LAALEAAPEDPARAGALSASLVGRAEREPAFAGALQDWLDQARTLGVEKSETHNTISGTVHGGAAQARDIGAIHFGSTG
jgi:hypothetical protein